MQRSCAFANMLRYPQQLVFVNFSDAGSEDDFVCEGDLQGRGARAGFVARDTRSGEGTEEKGNVFLRKC